MNKVLWHWRQDEQRFAILKEKGAMEEVVKSFSENLRNDVFALENQVGRYNKLCRFIPVNFFSNSLKTIHLTL